MERWLLREFSRLQARRLRELQDALETGRRTSPVPGHTEHAALIHRYSQACYAWGVAHVEREISSLVDRRRAQFGAEPTTPKGPQPIKAILWAQSRAGLQGKWERELDEEVQAVIAEGLAQGLTRRDISKRLAKVFPRFQKYRLENIARTETSSAYNAGRLDTMLANKFIKAFQFTAILDDRTTDICEGRHGRIMLLDDPNLTANTPPLHFQCRSTIIPIDKFDLEDLSNKVPAVMERYFGWTGENGPKTLDDALDWSKASNALPGFGKVSMPTAAAPLPAPLGKALVFKSGEPPDWADMAAGVGFPPGPKPESVMGKGDGELPIGHWKKVHPHDKIFEDPGKSLKTGLKQSSGVILVEPEGVWLVEPTGHFGGYTHTFPKGGVSGSLTHQQSALKELWEETGMQGELLTYLGEYKKTTSQTKLYIGKKTVGQPWSAGWETQAVKLVPWDQVESFLDQSASSGKAADIQAAKDLKDLVGKIWAPGTDLHDALAKHNDATAKAYAAAMAAKPVPPPIAPAPVKTVATPAKKSRVKLPKTDKAALPADWDVAWEPFQQIDFGAQASREGSNAGGRAAHRDGSVWYLKQPPSSDHSRNEHLASQLYRLAGVEVPDVRLVNMKSGQLGIASRIIDGTVVSPSALMDPNTKGVREHFAIDAWLGNWDVVGATHDNLKVKGDRAIRIDPGGALLYRAQGGPKGAAWNDEVSEWFSLRTMSGTTTAPVFAGASPEEILSGAQRVAAITPAQIREAVKRSGLDDSLAEMLIARQKKVVQHAEKYLELGGRGTHVDPSKFVATLKGSSADRNLDRQQKARLKEMAALIGEPAAKAYADLWYDWQSSSNSTGGKILRQEWELMVKRQPPKRPEIRAALAAQQVQLRNTFAVDKVTLYRGFVWSRVEEQIIAAAAMGKTHARVQSWEITSWATDRHAAFSGVKVKSEINLKDIVGGTGLSAGFNRGGKFSNENEFIVAADEINGDTSFFYVNMADTTSSKWGPGKKYTNPQEYAAHLRASDPATLDRILKDNGATQTLSKKKRKRVENFVQQAPGFESEGMMQQPQLDAETGSVADHYAAKQRWIADLKAKGLVGDIGQGLKPEEIFWGEGPDGKRK